MAVLRLGADEEQPDLREVLGGLPVAGFDGTLVNRYFAERTSDALGLVRAKTGTLTGTHALAGTLVDADGVLLGFVAVANGVKERHTLFARDQLDRIAAALAGCGCRR
jgi:D-alanyl-D-alanine carboxypeptidase/D-alanyl-D-alanine-endopeptidase (penicillin-binding protein 4)